ncbi:hypothetical protein HCR08_03960 [Wolbachia pipientis]|nr:hypothetical protein [Wolbachia pipientis]
MLLACYSHKHISYRIRTIIRKAITLARILKKGLKVFWRNKYLIEFLPHYTK